MPLFHCICSTLSVFHRVLVGLLFIVALCVSLIAVNNSTRVSLMSVYHNTLCSIVCVSWMFIVALCVNLRAVYNSTLCFIVYVFVCCGCFL